MASVTFGSVGDIIAICQVISTTINALSASRGSAVEYQALLNELASLEQAVEAAKSLLEKPSAPQASLLQYEEQLGIALQSCRESLDHELAQIQKFSKSLGKSALTQSAKINFWKLRWLGHKVCTLHLRHSTL